VIESLTDLYRYARALADDLRRGPESDLAPGIDVALAGTTSGEILGNLWFVLREVQQRNPELASTVVSDLAESIAFIEQVLGPPR
jgi:hypothetical protein